MLKWFKNAKVRLFGRAVVAGAAVIGTSYLNTGTVTRAVVVGGILVFAEVFTPLNQIVGYFKAA